MISASGFSAKMAEREEEMVGDENGDDGSRELSKRMLFLRRICGIVREGIGEHFGGYCMAGVFSVRGPDE